MSNQNGLAPFVTDQNAYSAMHGLRFTYEATAAGGDSFSEVRLDRTSEPFS